MAAFLFLSERINCKNKILGGPIAMRELAQGPD